MTQPDPACDPVILWCGHPLCPGQLQEGEEAPLDGVLCSGLTWLLRAWHRVGRPQLVQDQEDGENQTVLPGRMLQEASGKPGSGDRAQMPVSGVEAPRGSTKENKNLPC